MNLTKLLKWFDKKWGQEEDINAGFQKKKKSKFAQKVPNFSSENKTKK